MNIKPAISVVMATYNAHPYLNSAVESIINQHYSNFEFIIIDDCSTDESSFLSTHFRDDRIRLFHNNRNVGLTRSLNRGMEYVKAPFVVRFDADDYSEPHRLGTQLKYMKEHKLTLCGSDAQIINDNSKVLQQKKRLSTHEDIQFYTMLNNPFMHSSVMFRKECYDILQGYNNRITYAQDYHLWARWIQKFKVGNINSPLIKWRQSYKGISTVHLHAQKMFADKVCISYVRSVYPQLMGIPDIDIIAMRNGQYNEHNINNITMLFDTAARVSKSRYGQDWVERFKIRTNHLRG